MAVTVQPGDTLSEIAADHGVKDWTTVWPANAGRAEPDGARFTDPDYIEPGWTVTIPTPTGTGDNAGRSPTERVTTRVTTPSRCRRGTPSRSSRPTTRCRWTTVVAANLGRIQPDGSRLTDPDDIRPGWQILIPGDVTPTPGTATPPAVRSPRRSPRPRRRPP